MSIKEIQELTSSEPLTLEEEYEMQLNWLNDEDKLTFLVLSKELYDNCNHLNAIDKEITSMVGDVNIFLSTDDEKETDLKTVAELEIMIVDKQYRGKGFGIESIYLMMNYALQFLASPLVEKFIVRIDETNLASIKMFEKIGFLKCNYSAVFKQVTLKLDINENFYKTSDKETTFLDYTKFYKSFQLNIESII